MTTAERLLRSLDEPIATDWGRITVSGSIGIALSDGPRSSPERLLRDADVALYRAKAAGRGRAELLDAESDAAALRSVSIGGELARAIASSEFTLVFQPVVSLSTDRIASLEALVRWEHPSLGMLLPAAFLGVAERSVHMAAIGRWVLEEACSACARWRRGGPCRGGHQCQRGGGAAGRRWLRRPRPRGPRTGRPPARPPDAGDP